jgi:hypothetical protein
MVSISLLLFCFFLIIRMVDGSFRYYSFITFFAISCMILMSYNALDSMHIDDGSWLHIIFLGGSCIACTGKIVNESIFLCVMSEDSFRVWKTQISIKLGN